mgnify:CR=1 FL=1
MDEIKRTTGPQTPNGRRWEVQLSATPSSEWMHLFRGSREASEKALPQRVEFDRTSAYFKSEEDQVEHPGWDPRRVVAVEPVLPEGVTPPGTRGRILHEALALFAVVTR